ncbi:MAG: ATP-binding protein [bacterium]|nr:ATP-binding protein [bacterium]
MFKIKNIIVGFNNTITNIFRAKFDITDEWFENLLNIYYDDEIKSKYIPELHQDNSFEREHLNDILNFDSKKVLYTNQIRICHDYIKRFHDSYRDFYQYLSAENINIVNANNIYLKSAEEVFNKLEEYKAYLDNLDKIFKSEGYKTLQFTNGILCINHGIPNATSFNKKDWNLLLDKEPEEHILRYLFQYHNQVYYNLNELNMMLNNYKENSNHKIIIGKAGMGKSHITAHLIKRIKENEDFVIFLKPKFFNGDNVNFDECLLRLLQVPNGYTLAEILLNLNDFAKSKNKRCFIIIDALNETTKSNIGFSDIWNISLQSFINRINTHSNLYFISTLRTSYVDNIWDSKPKNLVEIIGFDKIGDLEKVCEKYFKYYLIEPLNFDLADLSVFNNPLLLDLFCKLTNEDKLELKQIELGINSYLKIFENYINKLTLEVKNKLQYAQSKPIKDGFYRSSTKFLDDNQAQIQTDEFINSFDTDPLISNDKSIARAVLEGYLVFIREFVDKPEEIVKHTQQEVGGYLLAKNLVQDYPNTSLLVNSTIFQTKIIGSNKSQQHQLRLDILKFLIALKPDIIDYTNSLEVLNLSWWFLYNGFNPVQLPGFDEKILLNTNNDKVLNDILNTSSKNWFNSKSDLNFAFISRLLISLDLWNYDLKWNYFVYQIGPEISSFISETIDEIKDDKIDFKEAIIKARFIAFVLSTNIRELRDKATICLIEFGKKHPIELLNLTIEFANLKDIYVYERLVSSCYGVALIKQNDVVFVKSILPEFANELFKLQFSSEPITPVYNYIVIDSIKHLLDLAILKGSIVFPNEDLIRIMNYEFIPPYEWIEPTEEQQILVDKCPEMSPPNPIRMDFGIYTIPRLVKREEIDTRVAIANVYTRIFELKYIELDLRETADEEFKDFVWGHKISGSQDKVDRLGKKYCWMAFFDYAGFLLLNKNLDVFDENENGAKYYNRLGDVDIDISLPNINYDIKLKLYNSNLLESRDSNPKWYEEIKIDSIKELFETNLEEDYTMLYGFVEQKIDSDYKVRSFLMVETFLIQKGENFEKLKKESDYFEWELDVHVSREHSRNSYFGELYWADSVPVAEENDVYIPTGEKIQYKRKRTIHDMFRDEKLNREDIGAEIDEISDARLSFNSEATLLDYLWESNSNILNGFGEYFPSVKMGKHLNLKADPTTGHILDNELNIAYKCISYEDNTHYKNTFNYMRSDLLRKYMAENNLALVYQVKQHSYDEDLLHNRKLKFFIKE